MQARSRATAAVGLVGLLVGSSCSLTTTSVDECKQTSDCRAAFGVGRICGADGFCAPAPPNPRCSSTFPPDVLTRPENYPGVLLVGSLFDRSIPGQVAREKAVILAATQVNEQKGVDGRLFGVVLCDIAKNAEFDSATRTEAAAASARYLSSVVGVSAIVGPSASADTLAVFDAVKNDDLLVISPASTSPALTTTEKAPATDEAPGRLWRTATSDELQGIAIVRHLRTAFPAVTSVALIQEKGPYGDSLATIFTNGFQQAGGTVQTFPFATGSTSERDAAIVTAGALKLPFVLFFSSSSTDSVALIKAAAPLDSYKMTQLLLTDSAATTEIANAARDANIIPRIVGSRPALAPGPTLDLFKTSYNAAFNADPTLSSFVAHSYDATWMAFYGTARALRVEGRVSGTGIARGLRKLSDGSPEVPIAPSSWKAITDALAGGGSVNVVGASGQLDFDPATEEATAPVGIWKVAADGSKIEAVTNIDVK